MTCEVLPVVSVSVSAVVVPSGATLLFGVTAHPVLLHTALSNSCERRKRFSHAERMTCPSFVIAGSFAVNAPYRSRSLPIS